MGGTNTDMGLVTENGNIVQRRSIPTNAYTELVPYVRDMMREIQAMVEEQRKISPSRVYWISARKLRNTFLYPWCLATTPTLPPMANMFMAEQKD